MRVKIQAPGHYLNHMLGVAVRPEQIEDEDGDFMIDGWIVQFDHAPGEHWFRVNAEAPEVVPA